MVRMDVGSRHGKLSVSDGEACGFSILGISGSHEVKRKQEKKKVGRGQEMGGVLGRKW